MARPVPVVEHAMEAQTRIRRLRKELSPLYAAALATGSFDVVAEAHALSETLRIAQLQSRRLAGLADGMRCADGQLGLGHGRAS